MTQHHHISINYDLSFSVVSLAIPVVVLLSQCIGAGGCECPFSCKISLVILDSSLFMKNVPSSAPFAEDLTHFNIPHTIYKYLATW